MNLPLFLYPYEPSMIIHGRVHAHFLPRQLNFLNGHVAKYVSLYNSLSLSLFLKKKWENKRSEGNTGMYTSMCMVVQPLEVHLTYLEHVHGHVRGVHQAYL